MTRLELSFEIAGIALIGMIWLSYWVALP